MRIGLTALALLLGLAASSHAGEVTAEGLQRDLHLRAWLTSDASVVPGESVRIGARIVNESSSETYALVRPGDGSESGWREPHVFFTAVRRSPRDGHVPVEEKAWGRCGLYDADWRKSVVTLAPGEKLDLTMHLMAASTFLDFQREGRTEIRLHYRWSGGKAHKGGQDASPEVDLGPLRGVPPFELVSDPVVIHVRRPVDVVATAVGSLRVGQTRTLADLLRVLVRNQTDDAIEFTPQHLQFELAATEPPDLLDLREMVEPQARVRAAPLRPRGERTLEGAKAFLLLRHLRLRARSEGTLKVAVVYAPGASDRRSDRSAVRIRSSWVTIRIEPGPSQSPPTALTTVQYRLAPSRTFRILDAGGRDLALADLKGALERHRRDHPGAEYELKADVKVMPEEAERIRAAFHGAGARLVHFWVPVSDRSEGEEHAGPHGPGFVDLMK